MKAALVAAMGTPSRAALASFGVTLALTVSSGCGGNSIGGTLQSSAGTAATLDASGGSTDPDRSFGGSSETSHTGGRDGGPMPTSSAGSPTTSEAGSAATSEAGSGDGGAMPVSSGGSGGANGCPVAEPGPPITESPNQIGCFEGVDGKWQKVPCLCELWVDSPSTSQSHASFSLSVTPSSVVPSLAGDVAINVVFPDAESSWFDIWQRQAENDTAFAISHSSDGMTTVRLGQGAVTLAPVPLLACESRRAQATINAPLKADVRLEMAANLVDDSGDPVAKLSGECFPIRPH